MANTSNVESASALATIEALVEGLLRMLHADTVVAFV
jgi:hypothetical protein